MPVSIGFESSNWSSRALGALRIVAGFLFMQHGGQKLFNFPPGQGSVDLTSLMGLAGALELFGGALLALGLFTRVVAFILSGQMAVAYFMAHAPQGFWPVVNKGELAVLYSFVFLFFAVEGGGAWSLDRLLTDSGGAYRGSRGFGSSLG